MSRKLLLKTATAIISSVVITYPEVIISESHYNLISLPVYVNEVLSNAGGPHQSNAIELFNPNDAAVEIGGWYLTDNKDTPRKFKIPSGTSIEAKGFIFFTEQDFNKDSTDPKSFSLSSYGDGAYIFCTDSVDSLSGFSHGFDFNACDKGISLGRVVDNSGREHFVPMKEITLGSKNSDPVVGPLVITEICYNAKNGADYLILKNVSDKSVSPCDPDRPLNTWRIFEIDFYFPKNVIINPGESILVIPNTITETLFRQLYLLPSSVKMFPYFGDLDEKGKKISLEKPLAPYFDPDIDEVDSIIPYMLVDEIIYGNSDPWPACELGTALCKTDPLAFGDDPSVWIVKQTSPGAVTSIFPGKSAKSPTMNVNWNLKDNLLQFVFYRSSNIKVNLYDISGRSVFSYSSFCKPGSYSIPCDMRSRTAGTYVLKIETGKDQVQLLKIPNLK